VRLNPSANLPAKNQQTRPARLNQDGFAHKGLTFVKPLFCLNPMRLIPRFMRFFFYHFYHSFAWSYDFVAAVVSIGRWNDWIRTIFPFVQGTEILEIGPGPGYLQCLLRNQGLSIIGLDESMQMIHLAKNRLERADYKTINLACGLAQTLPFPDAKFDSVISTFPSEYISDSKTLSEIHRVLRDDGHFIVLPVAWIVGRKLMDRAAAWLFQITGETPKNIFEIVTERFIQPLEQAGFSVKVREVEIRSSIVLVLAATK
jgi:ubiquinone/menaquinone biosynthesis C-methylase UbiE